MNIHLITYLTSKLFWIYTVFRYNTILYPKDEDTQQYVDYMPKRISKANQEFFAKEGSSLASGIKRCKRGK